MKQFVLILTLITVVYSKVLHVQNRTGCCQGDRCTLAEMLVDNNYAQGTYLSQLMLDSAIRLCPTNASYWREISVPYLKRGDYATWRLYIDRAVSLDPMSYISIRGWCKYKFLHDYIGAEADLQRYLSLCKLNNHSDFIMVSDFNIYLLLAFCEKGRGRYKEALNFFNKDINITLKEKGSDWVGLYEYLYRGILKYQMGNLQGAVADLDKQISRYPTVADSYYYKGLVLSQLKNKAGAIKALKKAQDLFLFNGTYIKDPYCQTPDQVYRSDISRALNKLIKNE